MSRSWRFFSVFSLLVLTVFPGFAETAVTTAASPAVPGTQAALPLDKPVLAGKPLEGTPTPVVKSLFPMVDTFFGKLANNDASGSLQFLFTIFPIDAGAQERFSANTRILLDRMGPPNGHEFIGFRGLGSCERYFLLYYLTYHKRMPMAWEFSFFRPTSDGPWQLNFIRYNSDEVAEFFSYPKLQFEAYLRLQEGRE